MMSVALTGDVAAGKSTVAGLWKEAGVPVVSADELARDVAAPGSEGLSAVRSAFGADVILPDGSLDRKAMRGLVFHDPAARARLEAILHPLIEGRRRAWMEAREEEGAPLAVAEIPLLFEVGLEGAHDASVVVTAPPEERLRRMADRGIDGPEAMRIMGAQMDPERKASLADYVLENGGTLDELRSRALELLQVLRRRAARE